MVHLYVEDREKMVWLPVLVLMRNGAPCLGDMSDRPKDFSNTPYLVKRFEKFCSDRRYNWMVSTINKF